MIQVVIAALTRIEQEYRTKKKQINCDIKRQHPLVSLRSFNSHNRILKQNEILDLCGTYSFPVYGVRFAQVDLLKKNIYFV